MRINQIFQGITAAGLDDDLREDVQEALRRILKERRKLGMDNDVEDLYWSRDAVARDLAIDREVMDALWRIPSVANVVRGLTEEEEVEEEEEEGSEGDDEGGEESEGESEEEESEETPPMHVIEAVNAVGHRVDNVHDDVRAIRGRVEQQQQSGGYACGLVTNVAAIMFAVFMIHVYHMWIEGGGNNAPCLPSSTSISHVWLKITSAFKEMMWRLSSRVVVTEF